MKFTQYESRFRAGEVVADYILDQDRELGQLINDTTHQFFCFTIPNGGVPVAEGFCDRLGLQYDMLIVRKIKIPYNTEAGFGSITTDGSVFINEALLPRLNLTQRQIENSIEITINEIKERLRFYHRTENLEGHYKTLIKNRYIFMMDDGLASGFTMLAALSMIQKYQPAKIYVSVPTAPLHTVRRIQSEVEHVFCPSTRDTSWFAVADAYKNWYDVPESEVIEILKRSKCYVGTSRKNLNFYR